MSCIMLKNGKTYFINFGVFTAIFLKSVSTFFNIMSEKIKLGRKWMLSLSFFNVLAKT